uniref:Uncharacterized protein n=1 Tax=Ciona savignyi TaxID=51511 RepID=H2Z5F2_CIOSA
MDAQNDPTIAPPEIKKRRNKPSKKRDCPAIMHIREIVMFPDFALDLERMFDTKYHVRQEKTNLILKLKQELAIHAKNNPSACTQAPLNGMQRFYVNIPLPEVHIGHPQPCGGIGPTIHPSVTAKIDDLLSHGIYDARHVRVIVHDYVREVVIMQDQNNMYQYNLVLFPTEHDIADYIYISSITVKPTIIVEDDTAFTSETGVKGEMEGSIQELMGLIQKCKDEETLQRAKSSMLKIIKTVKSSEDPPPKKKRKKKSTEEEDNDDDDLTEIIVFQNLEKDTSEQKEQASIEFNH